MVLSNAYFFLADVMSNFGPEVPFCETITTSANVLYDVFDEHAPNATCYAESPSAITGPDMYFLFTCIVLAIAVLLGIFTFFVRPDLLSLDLSFGNKPCMLTFEAACVLLSVASISPLYFSSIYTVLTDAGGDPISVSLNFSALCLYLLISEAVDGPEEGGPSKAGSVMTQSRPSQLFGYAINVANPSRFSLVNAVSDMEVFTSSGGSLLVFMFLLWSFFASVLLLIFLFGLL